MNRPRRPAPLLPEESGRDLPLLAVCAILIFLACLSVIGAAGAWQAASGWSDQLAGEMTLQVLPGEDADGDDAVREVGALASGLPGVLGVEVRARAASEALLRPWLGNTQLPDDFPLPRLVTLEVDPENPPAPGALDALFADTPYRVIVDDNQLWAGAIARASATVRYFALGLVFLMCAAAGAVIVFAARAALSMRRDIAEALHLVGAPDRFIVALFQERFFMLGVKSGAAGALLALLTSLCLNYAGGSAGTVFFLPGLAPGWGIIIIVPAAALASGIIAGLAARLTVRAGLLARWP